MEQIWRLLLRSPVVGALHSPRIQRYFQNISWLLFEKVSTFFIAMLVSVFVARYLRPEGFGLLSYAISFAGIFTIVTVSMDQVILRELSRRPENHKSILGTCFFLKLAGAAIIFVVIGSVLLFMNNDRLTDHLILIIAAAELFKAFEVINSFFQSKVLSKTVVKIQVIINLLLSLMKIALVFLQAPLIWFAWIVLVNSLFNAVGFYYVYRKSRYSIMEWKFSRSIARLFLFESWPIVLYGLAFNTQTRIDQVMLGKLFNTNEVGQYSVAFKLVEILGFVPMVLATTFTPPVSRAREVSDALYRDRLLNLYRLMFTSFLLLAIPLFLFGDDVVRLLYGTEYRQAGFLLSLFSIRLFFMHMGLGKSVFILNEGLFKYSLFTAITGAAINVIINFLLIPQYGSTGAFIAMLVSFTVSFFIDVCFFKMRLNLMIILKGMASFWKLTV